MRSKLALLAGALLPLAVAGAAAAYGVVPLTVHRVTMHVDVEAVLGPRIRAFLVMVLLFSIPLSAHAYRRHRRDLLRGLFLGLVLVELASGAALLVSLPQGGPDPWQPLFPFVLVERSVWLALALPLVVVLPVAAALFYSGFAQEGEAPRRAGELWLLAAALLVAGLSVFLPHTAWLNPGGRVVSTDTRFNAEWLEVLGEKGLLGGLVELAPRLRPLYMVFLYAVYRVSGTDPLVLADVYLPGLGFSLLAVTVYWVEARSGGRPGAAALLSALYWAPMFVYGGFQTNLYALPLALLYAREAWRSRWLNACVLGSLLGLWHPWTLAYYTVATLGLLALRRPRGSWGGVLAVTVPWLVTAAVNLALLGRAGPLAATVSPVVPGFSPLFALYTYVWGTLARPEVLLAAAYILASGRGSWAGWLAAPGFLAFPLLNATAGYRVLMQAPAPLLASRVPGRWVWVVVLAALVSWLYLVSSAPPL